jgi:hypothetical protein
MKTTDEGQTVKTIEWRAEARRAADYASDHPFEEVGRGPMLCLRSEGSARLSRRDGGEE